LQNKIGLTLSFFCAGSPSRKGTLELLRKLGIEANRVASLRYRGHGWPGSFSVTLKGASAPAAQLSYAESWDFVQAYRPFSTHLCPDGTGEDADISCGDPWYREVRENEPGLSLVVVRTEPGRQLLRRALDAGYVSLMPADPWKLMSSQKNLWAKRGAIGGRVATLAVMGLPRPKLRGFGLFRNWVTLSLEDKLRSTLGTVRRVLSRRYYKKRKITPSAQ
jgi:coenzyme F420 hydrogenase subunit beta